MVEASVIASEERPAQRVILDVARGSISDHLVRDCAGQFLALAPESPTNPLAIAEKLGVAVEPQSGLAVSAVLHNDGGQLRISYAEEQPRSRRNFTIAHELGHVLLYRLDPTFDQRSKHVETFCDRFAAELIMPADRFAPLVEYDITITKLIALSELFDASLRATAIRCTDFEDVSVLVGDEGALLWSTGRFRRLDRFLRARFRRTLNTRQTLIEAIRDRRSGRDWVIEISPLARSKDAIALVRPAAPVAPHDETLNLISSPRRTKV